MKTDVIVIGAGPAGLTAAAFAANRGRKVIVLEKNPFPGKKLRITGKGRCNVTNASMLINDIMDNIPRGGRFLYGAFSRFMPVDVMDLFEGLGVPLKVERGNRVFPVSDNAADIVKALAGYAENSGAKIKTGVTAAGLIFEENRVSGVKTADGQSFFADSVIVATGGLSYPLTGSTGDGYKFAKTAGHTVTDLRPSLVPLETDERLWRKAQGLTLKNIAVTVFDAENYKEVYSDFGEMIFTHFGVSGPVILSASAHLRDINTKKYILSVDLKPALDEKKLDARLLRDFSEFSNRNLSNALKKLLPSSLIPIIVELSGINPGIQVNKITREERKELVYLLKHLEAGITGTRPIAEAIITSGGVETKELDPKTMKSKLIEGLYFAGEVIDADAYTGGFNLQIAFSTGAAAGRAV
ncbi:MAG: NAD(P)/FAD-dependent oxidoreductase [Oscillospiraceae bacterium]|nr:NAD(P)/FAD-dependent oxidoreductase [Oscillospiraceae bacterium]